MEGWEVGVVIGLGLGLFYLVSIPFLKAIKKRDEHTLEADLKALKYGLKEPASLHPIVDLNRCIGSGGCVEACPEKDVLGLRFGQAMTVSPARCIGHGLCERSCPVNAITLVVGTEKRGVDIPRIQGNFETNKQGIHIVGELGGMGLIKNAFEQGKQCIQYIIKEGFPKKNPEMLDILIVGCGPAGLSAAITAKHHNLNVKVIEREDMGGTVRYYPRNKVVMTRPITIPGYGKVKRNEISKEELIELWETLVDHFKLEIQTEENVESIKPMGEEGYEVRTNKDTYHTYKVILAIGRRGTPRKLGIEGENLSNVAYSLREPDHFTHKEITVVGGGDSAVEAAMALAEQSGNRIRLVYRKNQFSRIKLGNKDRLDEFEKMDNFTIHYGSNVVKNEPTRIHIKTNEGKIEPFSNDHLFIFAGGILPTAFLADTGIAIDTKYGSPLNE